MVSEEDLRRIEDELKEKYPALWRVLEVLQESRQNPMILHNFVREFIFGNIEKETFELISDRLNKHFKNSKHLEGKSVQEIPEKIINILDKNFDGDCPFFLGSEIHNIHIPDYVCHYKSYNDLWEFYISKKWKKMVDPEPLVGKKKKEIREKLRKKEKILEEYIDEIELNGGKGKFFWVCRKKSDIDCYDDQRAQEVLDKLGMIIQEGDDLVEICISKSQIEGLCCPTIFDNAFDNDYFRTAYRKDGWGETVNISPNAVGGYNGYPQAISRPVSLKIKETGMCIIGCIKRNENPPELGKIFKESRDDLISIMGWLFGN